MKVTVTSRTIAVDASADDWELYDKPNRAYAASVLNRHFDSLVNRGHSRADVETFMYEKMEEFTGLGAMDSEGIRFLERLLNKAYQD